MKLLLTSTDDIEAFRAGVREQEAKRIDREYMQRDFDNRLKRVYASNAVLTTWGDVRAGDHLLDCEGGDYFFHSATVCGVYDRDSQGNLVAGDSVWVEYENIHPYNGSGGSRKPRGGIVLIDRKET